MLAMYFPSYGAVFSSSLETPRAFAIKLSSDLTVELSLDPRLSRSIDGGEIPWVLPWFPSNIFNWVVATQIFFCFHPELWGNDPI